MYNIFANGMQLAKEYAGRVLKSGGRGVDATAGNGYDTLFMAERVGPEGKVYAFDIQQAALDNTKARLHQAGVDKQVELVLAGHEKMTEYVEGPLDLVMFNLGYLPGGDHGIITRSENTIQAVKAGLELLRPGGLLTMVIYWGHPGGPEEAKAIEEFTAQLPQESYAVLKAGYLNRKQAPPYLIIIEKAGVKNEG